MKKLALVILGVAILAALIAHKPPPPSSNAGNDNAKSDTSVPAPPAVPPPSPPSTPAEPVSPSLSSPPSAPLPLQPGPAIPIAPDPPAAPDVVQAGEPPDVLEERRREPIRVGESPQPAMVAPKLMMKADHEGARNGCKNGDLMLDGAGLHFVCPSDTAKSLELALTTIKDAHENGLEDLKGRKYHFKIQNTQPKEAEKVFRNWLQQARAAGK